MSAMWIAPAIGPVERDGQGELARWLGEPQKLRTWLRQWEGIVIAELVWLTSGRREQ